MTAFLLVTAGAVMLLGAVALYLASANQRLLSRPPRRALALAGIAMLVIALYLLLRYSGAATAVFVLMTGIMLVWTLVPMTIAYWRHCRERALGESGGMGRWPHRN